jgi:hypothetical protein
MVCRSVIAVPYSSPYNLPAGDFGRSVFYDVHHVSRNFMVAELYKKVHGLNRHLYLNPYRYLNPHRYQVTSRNELTTWVPDDEKFLHNQLQCRDSHESLGLDANMLEILDRRDVLKKNLDVVCSFYACYGYFTKDVYYSSSTILLIKVPTPCDT